MITQGIIIPSIIYGIIFAAPGFWTLEYQLVTIAGTPFS